MFALLEHKKYRENCSICISAYIKVFINLIQREMEILLFFSVYLLAAAQAGLEVGKVEAESIRLQLHGGSLDQGLDGNSTWSCTRISSGITGKNEDSHGWGWGKEQLVFVEQEPTHYKHKVVIKGLDKPLPNTTVYVIPANNTHQIDVHAEGISEDQNSKPSFFFLKENPLNPAYKTSTTNSTSIYGQFNSTNPI